MALGLYRSGSGSEFWERIEGMGMRFYSPRRWTLDPRRARLVERLARHPIDPENLDWVEEAIGAWHDGDCPELELHEYLGWSRERYGEWFAARSSAPSGVVVESNDAARWTPDRG